ncbi:hypothetical protein FQN54_006193 [Arachnomyces sp. PD_36]|nr:hypothetical protein FQN54_006193 [Arachnomyces sp. PD_36]
MSPATIATRNLPEKHNPLVSPEASPDYEELLARRRLGKTNLSVKAAQIGTTNATKPENLGVFEYAHLRAPLPKDLSGSEIFAATHQQTETYFLMRRSKDGFVSATGMFKIAFPWAKIAEEKAERDYLKSMPTTSQDEVANNVWISPDLALELAKEYRMVNWVRALLDSSEIVQSPASAKKLISPPPKFEMPPLDAAALLPPPSTRGGRSRRSVSPSKIASPKKGSSRRGRQTKAMKEANAASASAANASLQSALDSAASAADSEEKLEVTANGDHNEEAANGVEKAEKEDEPSTDKVKVDVQTTVDTAAHTEKTDVSVEMPVGLPELPLPEDTEDMIAKAKEMVAEANKLQEAEGSASASSPKESKKRKTDESVEDGESADATDTPAQPAKKAKVLEDRLRRERVRNRALVGVTATLAVAAAIPYFF